MSFFGRKITSSLPQEILASVHTMRDDLDGKSPVVQATKQSALPGTEHASPFTFSSAPAMKNMAPVNENGLTSPITITSTDSSHADPDPKDSSPFLSSNQAEINLSLEPSKVALESKPTERVFPQEKSLGNASFASENVALGANAPSYFPEASSRKKKGIFIVGVIMLTIALLAGGAFAYFSFFEKKESDLSSLEVPTETPNESTPVSISEVPDTETVPPFTISSPNYLPIDVETVTAEQFRTILLEKQALLEADVKADMVVEFFVTDKNNTPIAFARLATLMGMTLPPAVMDEIDESFSLYLYNENRIPRIGLSVSVKNKDLLQSAVKKDESAIPFSLQALYLDSSVMKITAGAFRDGIYKTYQTRYFNISTSGLSNDYTFTEKHWVIGTSKKSFQKILDTFGTAL